MYIYGNRKGTSLGFMSECDTMQYTIKTTLLAAQPSNRFVGYTNVGDSIQFQLEANLQGKLRGSETDAMFKDKYIEYIKRFSLNGVLSVQPAGLSRQCSGITFGHETEGRGFDSRLRHNIIFSEKVFPLLQVTISCIYFFTCLICIRIAMKGI